MLDLALANLFSPAVLCFALGVLACRLGSDLRIPEPVQTGLSAYLMLAIGLRGGVELSQVPLAELAGPLSAALLMGCAIPVWSFFALRRLAGLGVADAAALAAHYGSVSAVTFAAVTATLEAQGIAFEGHATALLAVMEVPAIVVGIGLARLAGAAGGRISLAPLGGVIASKSVLLLLGGLVIGALAGPAGLRPVQPFFNGMFPGVLCLFLLELGRLAAERLGDFAKVGGRLLAFALLAPVAHALLGLLVAAAAGLGEGGAVVFATLCASASYIAAPAAVRAALPEANPSLYLTCALGITFPFNIIFGLPLYQAMAAWLQG
jgi:hypothetical protein